MPRVGASGPGWEETYTALTSAARTKPLSGEELERLGVAAYLTGKETESAEALGQAHSAFLDAADTLRAVRSAFSVGFVLMGRGERARAGGWFARARRVLEEHPQDCAERGYLLLPVALEHAAKQETAAAEAIFEEAARIGARFGDADLTNLARQGRGRALLVLGNVTGGLSLLDEAMVAVTAGEVSPIISGIIYCSVISACFEILDVRRAQEWTDALDRWCASQPALVPYRPQCLVHRAEIMLLHGMWVEATEEAQRACQRLADQPVHPTAGAACYQLAEAHRLRGEFEAAEDAYRRAADAGRSPQPGLALLRLAQRQYDAARAAICRSIDESRQRRTPARILAAAVEILVAAGDIEGAAVASAELSAIANALPVPFVRALAHHACATVLLARNQARDALTLLDDARTIWRELQIPYEAARVGVLVARACGALGDREGMEIELQSAAHVFRGLGAVSDLRALEDQPLKERDAFAGPLTSREIQVLKLIARGRTNRSIGQELAISEKTVARHVSNIFTKIDVSSRAAATAYAFEHGLT